MFSVKNIRIKKKEMINNAINQTYLQLQMSPYCTSVKISQIIFHPLHSTI